jgi:plastocyanin
LRAIVNGRIDAAVRKRGRIPVLRRRLTVAVTATAVIGFGAAGVATTAGAAKKNEIRIVGGTKLKPGKYLKNDLRFTPPNLTVKSGSTVTLRNKSKEQEPHTITFVAKKFLPTGFESAVNDRLNAAHKVDPNNEEAPPGVFVVDNGQPVPAGGTLNVDTGFTPSVAGDSAFIPPDQKTFRFKVTAKKRSKLFYYCAIHPWMQGKITVR